MPQTIEQIKTILQSIKPDANIVNDTVIIQLVNEVDGYIHYNLFKENLQITITLSPEINEYDLPMGVTFDLVENVYNDGVQIHKIDQSFKDTTGYYIGSTPNKLKIYPTVIGNQDWSNDLTVTYLKPFVKHTSLSDTVYADAPFDKMYYEYLFAKISLFKADIATFNNLINLYNTSLADYEQWYNERFTNRKE